MKPRISSRHGTISQKTKEHIDKSCTKLEYYSDRIMDCEVVLDKTKRGDKVEIIVKVPQSIFASSVTGENLYKALAGAENKIQTQLKKHYDKLVSHH